MIFGAPTGLAYAAATLFYLHYFVVQKQTAEYAGRVALWIGFILHTTLLINSYVGLDRFPVISLKESLSFFSWALAGMYLAMRIKPSAEVLGTLSTPVITVFFFVGAFVGGGEVTADERFTTILFPLHILASFAGYAAFALAFLLGLMYLVQERGIKSRRPGKLQERLPSISELDSLMYRALAVGFPLLTLGLILGAAWLHKIAGVFVKWDPKIMASLVTWLVYAIILHSRILAGWRGRKMAAMSIIGFLLVLFTFFYAGFAASGFHRFLTRP